MENISNHRGVWWRIIGTRGRKRRRRRKRQRRKNVRARAATHRRFQKTHTYTHSDSICNVMSARALIEIILLQWRQKNINMQPIIQTTIS